MKPLLRFGVSLRTLLVFSALLKISQAECNTNKCNSTHTSTITTTNTTVAFGSTFNCNLTTENNISGNGEISGLTPGTVYQISFGCFNCCQLVTTKPNAVMNLDVTNSTTSSVLLTWSKPDGKISFYKIQWTNGTNNGVTVNVTGTSENITGLTAGVKYDISVTTVAEDSQTEGEKRSISGYTKPEAVRNLTVAEITTSSVSLKWTKPEGQSSFYRVQWNNETTNLDANVSETKINVTELTAGVQYNFTVLAVAGDNKTQSEKAQISHYTRPGEIGNHNVSTTTSSISLRWTAPPGEVFMYRVKWNNGGAVMSTYTNDPSAVLSGLIPGTIYTITIIAVAGDNQTEGDGQTFTSVTKPEAVRNLTVAEITTSSVSLKWTKPEGQSSFYRVQWNNETTNLDVNVSETEINVTELTAGVQYNFTVLAVAGDNKTQSEKAQISHYTRPGEIGNHNVSTTTSSISLRWTAPPGEVFMYRVKWDNGGAVMSTYTNDSSAVLSGLIPGTIYTITIIAVAGDNQTEGDGQTFTSVTKPEAVRNLTVTEITTSSVFLNWTKPEGQSSFYRVQWSDGNVTKSDRVNETYLNISKLTAGEQYTFAVMTVAGDQKTLGEAKTVSLFTKPEAVRNLTVAEITTSSVSLKWTTPEGKRSFYRVQWNNETTNLDVNVSETKINVTKLTAGVQYNFTVLAVAGDNKTQSEKAQISHYTRPGEIGNHNVSTTTSSISLRWTAPPGEVFMYRVKWDNGGAVMSTYTNDSSAVLSGLIPGTIYTITIIAVAGDNQTEGDGQTFTSVTKPEAVRNLTVTEITTSSVFLNWTKPEGQSSFYRVQWSDGNVTKSDRVNETYLNISELTAGEQYTFAVMTVAGDQKTLGEAKTVSLFAKPEAVRNLTVTEITTSSVSLKWTTPEGKRSFYRVQWNNETTNLDVNVSETEINVTELTAGVQYNFTVLAVAGDNKTQSEKAQISHYTTPEAVRNLNVTEITTSSVFLKWTEPMGKSSFYRVQWTIGTTSWDKNVTETGINVTELTAGEQYKFVVIAVAGDNKTTSEMAKIYHYTKPEAVRNLSVTEITTSSVSLKWTKPEGQSSFYRVQWSNGNVTKSDRVNETYLNISELTAGEQYTFAVMTVAGDQKTLGEAKTVSLFTKPNVVRNLTVTDITTSSISLKWTEPDGKSSFYRVQWTRRNFSQTANVTHTYINITNLTPGVQYEIAVTAVAGDSITEGQSTTVSKYTRPDKISKSTMSTTTSSISLNWTAPPGEVFKYRVKWDNGGAVMSTYTNDSSAVLSGLIPGTSYTITIIAVAGDNQTGDGLTFTSVTKPAAVKDLTVTDVTTSNVSLSWTKPDGNATWYIVQWTTGKNSFNNTTTETSFTITDLKPGFEYNITVAAVAGIPSNQGEMKLKTTFTKPEKPVDIMVTTRGTAYLNISWTLPKGRVDHYVVNISNLELVYFNNSTPSVTTAKFTGLKPGRIYVITVTAVAGPFSVPSDPSSLATIPTSPGSIIISQRTNSSLHLNWASPDMMDGAPHISYFITYQAKDGQVQNENATVNNITLSLLSSGTLYNLTVETVGPQNLRSTPVHNSAFTLPNPVLKLVASPKSTTSVEVKWSNPQGVRPYYTYLVQTYNTSGAVSNTTVNSNSTDVSNLEPGTGYNISVTTIAAEGSESTVEQTFSYTRPQAVTNITVEYVNTTVIQLEWLRQRDYKPTYSYLVEAFQDGVILQKNSTVTESYTFFSLTPGKVYIFEVFTVVDGVRSTAETKSIYTNPEAVNNITVIGSTTNLSVSWTPVGGQVDFYTVLLYEDNKLVGNNTDLSNTTLNTMFLARKPGVIYCAVIITKSGPLKSNSGKVCNATFPNPPGPIMVESQTVESINFTWPLPQDMDHQQYNFSVSSLGGTNMTENNWFLLDSLESGSPYNISVVTVGVLHYKSTPVTAENYTRPHPVTSLRYAEITTDAVTLVWKQQGSKSHYSYVVQTSNGSISRSETVNNTMHTVGELLSGSNYSFTVTTQTADGTQAEPVTVSYFTRPFSIKQLAAKTLNSTTIHLKWMKPPEYKDEYTYRVETTGCGETRNKTLSGEDTLISELTPGTNCTLCVFVRAADGIEGAADCASQYTKPESVQPQISSQGSNSSILVSWMLPPGRVEYYEVYLNDTSTCEQALSAGSTSCLFKNLSAGRFYTAVVTTFSGPFNASSGFITNATFPNPPGPIEVRRKTNSSIDIRWGIPPVMTGASFQYQLNISPQGKGEYVPGTSTDHTFDMLLSGTSYTISIVTVGVMGFVSEKVQIDKVTTRPFSVENLSASTEEKNITVMWDKPNEHKAGYRYNVTWQGSKGAFSSVVVGEKHKINDLVPGSPYDLSVTTETSDGTEGTPQRISQICTNASPVINLKCEGPNKPNAEVILRWTTPIGQTSGLRFIVNNSEIINTTNTCCSHTVSNLKHNTEYRLSVTTLSCGKPSVPVIHDCRTGITNPPIPVDYESLLTVPEKNHNKFSVNIDGDLLNSTNGPITHVGVLVTRAQSGITSNLTKYLGNTYGQWKEGQVPVYLATVRDNKNNNNVQSRSEKSSLTIEIGDETTWNGYTNGPLDANGEYKYAIVLFTQLSLQNNLVNATVSLVSITNFYPPVTLPANPAVIAIAVGVTLGIFCVLFIILIGFIIYWKRLSNKEASDIQIHSLRAKVSVAVRVEDYEAYYRKQKADSNCGFAEEFEDLKLVGTGQSKTNALHVENKPKNRYNNVLPYDSSRVKLSIIHGSPYDDYINANYMPGYNSRKEFIAAQGPLPATVSEFWRMIWEKNVQTLVMLTRCNEQGRVKCEQYWDRGTKHFENITVTTTSEIPLEDWTIRDFDVKNVKTAETRPVRHFHFTAWPDHGVPETTELLISFRHLVREHMDQYSRHSPTVVHCSAGVGRTGTFIAIDCLLFQIERENIVDVYGIVHDLRMHRPLMVQTEDQYVFLNQCAMDIIKSRTGTNVDLIYQNTAALSIYENVEPKKGYPKNGYHNA